MRLILVRHGRPDEDDAVSPNDPPLNEDGRLQARAVADRLARERVGRIVASPLKRARQTAVPLAERLDLPIETIDGWAEADRAAARYRSTETLRAEGGEAWGRFLQDPIRYLGAEPAEFRAGVLAALRETARGADQASRVAVFTHGLPINVVLSHALGLERITHFYPGYGSLTRLRRRGEIIKSSEAVMAGLVPAIHVVQIPIRQRFATVLPLLRKVLLQSSKVLVTLDVNGRDKPGHDGFGAFVSRRRLSVRADGGVGVVSVNESGHLPAPPTTGVRHG